MNNLVAVGICYPHHEGLSQAFDTLKAVTANLALEVRWPDQFPAAAPPSEKVAWLEEFTGAAAWVSSRALALALFEGAPINSPHSVLALELQSGLCGAFDQFAEGPSATAWDLAVRQAEVLALMLALELGNILNQPKFR
jgi:hypothetical protein